MSEPEFSADPAPADAAAPAPSGPRRWPGRLALVLALGMVVAVGVALAIDGPGNYEAATIVATVAIGLSGVGLLLGILSVFTGYGRGAAIAAIVIAVLGNPLVLLYGLGMLQ
ncbi:MAG TPA: hypothetical protein VN759_08480 [Pseudolysinimonas sp.]|nr:hypothetical protein [Pseudolysinimonas sp.]